MRKVPALLVWLVGIVFPTAWLGRFSAVYRWVFNRIFGPEWTHVFMHMLIYGVLCILLLVVIYRTARPAAVLQVRHNQGAGLPHRRLALVLIGVVLVVGFIQESLQWMSQGVVPWRGVAFSASLYDLGIDLLGGLLGVGVVVLWRVYRPS